MKTDKTKNVLSSLLKKTQNYGQLLNIWVRYNSRQPKTKAKKIINKPVAVEDNPEKNYIIV